MPEKNKWPRRAKGGGKKSCSIGDCKRPYRAKGYCHFHYKKWRQAELPHSRYRVCSKAECRIRVAQHGLCQKHFEEAYQAKPSGEAAKPAAEEAPAAS